MPDIVAQALAVLIYVLAASIGLVVLGAVLVAIIRALGGK